MLHIFVHYQNISLLLLYNSNKSTNNTVLCTQEKEGFNRQSTFPEKFQQNIHILVKEFSLFYTAYKP